MILREKNVPYELVAINIADKQNSSPEYLQMQPFGQVPVLDDNGYLIYGQGFNAIWMLISLASNSCLFSESRAIGRYIALKYASQGTQGLLPDYSDFEAVGKFEEACSLEYSQFNPSAEGLAQEVIFKKYRLFFILP
jgi:glutathione S-transferase